MTLFLIVPALVMAAGVVGAIPLTGVVTPFLSYGGSAMAANLAALGILSSIHADKRPAVDFGSFDVPLRWVSGAVGVAAVALVGVEINIQVSTRTSYSSVRNSVSRPTADVATPTTLACWTSFAERSAARSSIGAVCRSRPTTRE